MLPPGLRNAGTQGTYTILNVTGTGNTLDVTIPGVSTT